MKLVRNALVLGTLAGLIGCNDDKKPEAPVDVEDDSGASKIPFQDNRSTLFPDRPTERRFHELIEDGATHGLPDGEVPYPDTYWPMMDNGIAVNWLEKDGTRCDLRTFSTVFPDDVEKLLVPEDDGQFQMHRCVDPQPSPLGKYLAQRFPESAQLRAQAMKWETDNHGLGRSSNAGWFGHCPGWTAGTHQHKPLSDPAFAKLVNDQFVACEPGSEGCTRFEIGDINALTAEVNEGAESKFIGDRCDLRPEQIAEFMENAQNSRTRTGKLKDIPAGCEGVNFGASMIVLGTAFKGDNPIAIAIDAQEEFNTEQIWNQPAFRYTINRVKFLTEEEALRRVNESRAPNGVIGRNNAGAAFQNYDQINDEAEGFAFVDVTVHWVAETGGPNIKRVSGLDTANHTRMVGIIEADKKLLTANGTPVADAKIIGGELLDDPFVGASRLVNNPFMWRALGPSPDVNINNPAAVRNARRNPFIKAAHVAQLIEISHQETTGGGDRGGRGAGRRGGLTCDAALSQVVTCLQGGTQAMSCLADLSPNGDAFEGFSLLRDCGFI